MNGWLLVAGDFRVHGGMDRANLELARFLATERPVHIVAHQVADELAGLPNILVHRIRRPFGRHSLGQPLLAVAGRRWANRLSRDGYRVIVNGGNCRWPDVNWVHCVHSAYPMSLLGDHLRQIRLRTVHRLNRWDERRAIRAARLVICNSQRTADDVINQLDTDPTRVHVVYLGCDATRLTPVSQEDREQARLRLGWPANPCVGFIGQLGNKIKGFDTLFAAWQELCRDSSWDADLVVIGEGPNRTRWESRAAHDGLAGRIRFLGFRRDVPDLISACDVLVAPSRYDAYGLAAHEALCRGVPVVVSRQAGISERYPPDLAELVQADPESPTELAQRLRHWRANQDSLIVRVRSLSDALRSRSWTDMAREMRDLILAQ